MLTNNSINSSQVAFSAYKDSPTADVTGDGSSYDVICNQIVFDTTEGGYNTATGVFLVPISGTYFFNASTLLTSIGALHTSAYIEINNVTSGHILNCNTINAAAVRTASDELSLSAKGVMVASTGDAIKLTIKVSNSTLTVALFGAAPADQKTWFEGYLLS